jgi:hypothetical protein
MSDRAKMTLFTAARFPQALAGVFVTNWYNKDYGGAD